MASFFLLTLLALLLCGCRLHCRPFHQLPQDGQTHRNMEPVQHMLSLRVQIVVAITNGVAAI